MTRYIKIESCEECPYLGHLGAFGDVAYKPLCQKSNKTIPYSVTGDNCTRVRAVIKKEIPSWCSLSKEQIFSNNTKYLIGQRVIYNDNVICTIYKINSKDNSIWVNNPELGYEHYIDINNIKPLPNGQL